MTSTSREFFIPLPPPPLKLLLCRRAVGEGFDDLQCYLPPPIVEMRDIRRPGALILIGHQRVEESITKNKASCVYPCYVLKEIGSLYRKTLFYRAIKGRDGNISLFSYVCP